MSTYRSVEISFQASTVVEGLTCRESCLRLWRTLTRESLVHRAFGAGHVHGTACRVPRANGPLSQEWDHQPAGRPQELAPWSWAVAAGSEVSGRLTPVAPQLHGAVRGSPAVYIMFVPYSLSGNLFVRCLRRVVSARPPPPPPHRPPLFPPPPPSVTGPSGWEWGRVER